MSSSAPHRYEGRPLRLVRAVWTGQRTIHQARFDDVAAASSDARRWVTIPAYLIPDRLRIRANERWRELYIADDGSRMVRGGKNIRVPIGCAQIVTAGQERLHREPEARAAGAPGLLRSAASSANDPSPGAADAHRATAPDGASPAPPQPLPVPTPAPPIPADVHALLRSAATSANDSSPRIEARNGGGAGTGTASDERRAPGAGDGDSGGILSHQAAERIVSWALLDDEPVADDHCLLLCLLRCSALPGDIAAVLRQGIASAAADSAKRRGRVDDEPAQFATFEAARRWLIDHGVQRVRFEQALDKMDRRKPKGGVPRRKSAGFYDNQEGDPRCEGMADWLASGGGGGGSVFLVARSQHCILVDTRAMAVIDPAERASEALTAGLLASLFPHGLGPSDVRRVAVAPPPGQHVSIRDSFPPPSPRRPAEAGLLGDGIEEFSQGSGPAGGAVSPAAKRARVPQPGVARPIHVARDRPGCAKTFATITAAAAATGVDAGKIGRMASGTEPQSVLGWTFTDASPGRATFPPLPLAGAPRPSPRG